MIQELLGGSSVSIIGGDRSKLSTTTPCGGGGGGILDHASPSPSPPPSSAAAPENLRCPRCDSANTKFCYYNNYNLTQPRHFCKTCRRYWTKGGALRNVPIGGGCRKNKTTAIAAKSAAKLRTPPPPQQQSEMALSPIPNPMIWASPQNSHFLSLIRGNPNHLAIKDETSPNLALHRNQTQFVEAQHHGLQELYHRLRLSPNFYPEMANSSTILESAPVAAAADHMGFWGSNASWAADLPTANGAYP